jgi:hypothetical protein
VPGGQAGLEVQGAAWMRLWLNNDIFKSAK